MADIYLEREGALVDLVADPFVSEDELQVLIEQHGRLLGGEQINRDAPRRFLLVRREAGVPFEDGGSDRWSLDHLFVDQNAVPTLVEVKRSTDTRIRREVVGQMLDYAANASIYWPAGRLKSDFVDTCEAKGHDPVERLAEFLGDTKQTDGSDAADAEDFWNQADSNLRSGDIRLLFVADKIPVELQRIIEFLNERMTPTEVLGVEVRRFKGEGVRAMIPSVIGQTAAAQSAKNPSAASRSYQELAEDAGEAFAQTVRLLDDWASRNGLTVAVKGKSRRYGLDSWMIMWLYPTWREIDFVFPELDERLDVSNIHAAIADITDGRAKKTLYCEGVVRQWATVEREVLDPYLAACRATIDEAVAGSTEDLR